MHSFPGHLTNKTFIRPAGGQDPREGWKLICTPALCQGPVGSALAQAPSGPASGCQSAA